jgi:hypothetical protein
MPQRVLLTLAVTLSVLGLLPDIVKSQEIHPSAPPLVGPLINQGGGFWSDGTGKTFYWQPNGQISPGPETVLPSNPAEHGLRATTNPSERALNPVLGTVEPYPRKEFSEPRVDYSPAVIAPHRSRAAE